MFSAKETTGRRRAILMCLRETAALGGKGIRRQLLPGRCTRRLSSHSKQRQVPHLWPGEDTKIKSSRNQLTVPGPRRRRGLGTEANGLPPDLAGTHGDGRRRDAHALHLDAVGLLGVDRRGPLPSQADRQRRRGSTVRLVCGRVVVHAGLGVCRGQKGPGEVASLGGVEDPG